MPRIELFEDSLDPERRRVIVTDWLYIKLDETSAPTSIRLKHFRGRELIRTHGLVPLKDDPTQYAIIVNAIEDAIQDLVELGV